MTKPIGIVNFLEGPNDLSGPLRHFRWFAVSFGPETEVIYDTFEEAVDQCLFALDAENIRALADEVRSVIEQLDQSGDEKSALEMNWYKMGAQWWPPTVSFKSGLQMILGKLEGLLDRRAGG